MKVYEGDRTVYDQGQSFGGHPVSGHLERSQQKVGDQTVREVEGKPRNAVS